MTNSSTSDPKAARAHAHAMAGTRVEAMPTIPASSASDLPIGVTADAMLWEEAVGAGGFNPTPVRVVITTESRAAR